MYISLAEGRLICMSVQSVHWPHLGSSITFEVVDASTLMNREN